MSNRNARQIRGGFKIGDVQVPVTNIELQHTVEEPPSAQVSVQIDQQRRFRQDEVSVGGVKIDLNQFGRIHQLLQDKILNRFKLETDARLVVSDGIGNEIQFNGFSGRPTMTLRNGELMLNIGSVHPVVALQAYTSQIYAQQNNYAVAAWRTFLEQNDRLTDSIAERVLGMVEVLARDGVINQDSTSSTAPPLPVHNLNLETIDRVKQFLESSIELTRYPGVDRSTFDEGLHQTLYQVLSGSPNFLMALRAISESFLFQMNANWSGESWMEHWGMLAPSDGRVIQSPEENIKFSMNHMFELPVSQVLIQSGGRGYFMLSDITSVPDPAPSSPKPTSLGQAIQSPTGTFDTSLTNIRAYPETISQDAKGQYYLVRAPRWVASPSQASVQNAKERIGGSKFETAVSRLNQERGRLQSQDKDRDVILDHLSRIIFKDINLKNTRSNISIPLDLRPQVGRNYEVRNLDGQLLFSGYLRSVNHYINLGTGGGSSYTTLTFSHILAPDVTLQSIASAGEHPIPKVFQ